VKGGIVEGGRSRYPTREGADGIKLKMVILNNQGAVVSGSDLKTVSGNFMFPHFPTQEKSNLLLKQCCVSASKWIRIRIKADPDTARSDADMRIGSSFPK
jgi:hypothetical protein